MFDPTQINTINISLHSFVLLVLYFIIAVYTIFSAIFYYHWQNYSTEPKVTTYTLTLYFATTIPLVIIMSILALTIT
jgi:heme/copper-type cytochrome/quinol oxidase subunit 2